MENGYNNQQNTQNMNNNQVQPNQQQNVQPNQQQNVQQNQQQNVQTNQEDLNKVMLNSDPHSVNNRAVYYKNNLHLECPSYKNLMPKIREAIDYSREKSKEAVWFQKYRPALIEELLFPNDTIRDLIFSFVRNQKINGNCMFYGSHGLGKTTANFVLMNSCLTHPADKFVLERGIESVDKLIGWIKGAKKGNQKIVICEEFDQMSSKAMTVLKDGVLERNDLDVVVLITTNYPDKIDAALRGRFQNQICFNTIDRNGLAKKIEYILGNEKIQYNDNSLREFLQAITHINSIRDILSSLQLCTFRGILEADNLKSFSGSGTDENNIITYVLNYINYFFNYQDLNVLSNLRYNLKVDQNVVNVREEIIKTTKSNLTFNFDVVYRYLIEQTSYIPLKDLLISDYNDIDLKKVKYFHFEATLDKIIGLIADAKGAR